MEFLRTRPIAAEVLARDSVESSVNTTISYTNGRCTVIDTVMQTQQSALAQWITVANVIEAFIHINVFKDAVMGTHAQTERPHMHRHE